MPTPAIKICGLKDPAHLALLGELNVTYAGFVFVPKSPRYVSFTQAHALTDAARQANVKTVGLFCNAPRPAVSLAAEALRLDVVQLHGQEDANYLRTLTLPQGTRAWQAIPFTPENVNPYRGANLDALLLDAPPRADDPHRLTGGTGHAFDWTVLETLDRTGLPPLALAGGLTPNNVADAIRTAQPDIVDVSSGVESTRGTKDPDLIRRFVGAVQSSHEGEHRW